MACAKIVGRKPQQWHGCGGTPAKARDDIIVSAYTTNCPSDRTETIKSVNNAELNAEENYKEIMAEVVMLLLTILKNWRKEERLFIYPINK